MSVVRSKICGITRIEDALVAAEAGADAIGLVFYPKSPRAVSVSQAREIMAALPPFVTTVGLFVDPQPTDLQQLLCELPLDLLQFHGAESADFCAQFGRPWYKAIRMKPGENIRQQCRAYGAGQGILFDTYQPGVPGGTGATFDWALLPQETERPIILAGGLSVDNISQALAAVNPYAVDVSGGVESRKGVKDPYKVRDFVQQVRAYA